MRMCAARLKGSRSDWITASLHCSRSKRIAASLKGSRSGRIVAVAVVLVTLRSAAAEQPPAPPISQEPQTMLLWPGGAPGALGQDDRDKPAITVYMPPNTTGPMAAVIIAPGGGCARLSMNNDGRAPANYLSVAQQDPALAEWPRLLANWLRVGGFLK